ncbi:MAG: hypothetical protein FJ130_11570 [Deltaproteobacteria bacterium]|nr:hypothetical protein [Deltaproteobacteria bacterium]
MKSKSFVKQKMEELTEKWKHLKAVHPGEVNIVLYCVLDSTHYRPVRRYGLAFELCLPVGATAWAGAFIFFAMRSAPCALLHAVLSFQFRTPH